jgi:hypothetical protein
MSGAARTAAADAQNLRRAPIAMRDSVPDVGFPQREARRLEVS